MKYIRLFSGKNAQNANVKNDIFTDLKQAQCSGDEIAVSSIIMGCMRIGAKPLDETERLIKTALQLGINTFDHADIYGGDHACERHFGRAVNLKGEMREHMIIQTKCGITPCGYDFSKEHIITQVENSLHALGTDYIDILLLHRPDVLADEYEVGEAFDRLFSEGKVRHFGVSNFNSSQISVLQRGLNRRLIINQLQFGLAHPLLVSEGISANTGTAQGAVHNGGSLEYARLNDICLQAWSPFQYGFFGGSFLGNTEKYPKLNAMLCELGEKYNTAPSAVAAAWILRLPQKISVVLGTANPVHLAEAAAGSDITLTRKEWYGLYKAAGFDIP